MEGPSSNHVRCANKNGKIKDRSRGICRRGSSERKYPFKSKCGSGTCWYYSMDYGVIEFISMTTFREGVLSLELQLYNHYAFPKTLIYLFIVLLSYFQVPFIRFQAIASLLWDWGEQKKGRAQVWNGF
jgi:hypothetical protein